MEKIILNNTPVRTSVNFGINDIKLKDFVMPEIDSFNSLTVKNDGNVKILDKVEDTKLEFGISEILENANKNISKTIEIESDSNAELDFITDKENTTISSNIVINAKENTTSTVVLKYTSADEEIAFVSNKVVVNAKENATIKVVILNMLNEESQNFMTVQSNVLDNGTVNFIYVDFGAKTSITNYFSDVTGNSAVSTIDSIYLGDKEKLIDINYICHLKGEKTDVNIETQGALKDRAVKNFKGTIDFKRGCKKAKGNENEFCMLLSKTARSRALPMLLCTEDDVEGNHSSASGKVDKKQLFYLMSRGFSQNEAMKLIVRAKFMPIIDKIEDEEIRKEVIDLIDKKLD